MFKNVLKKLFSLEFPNPKKALHLNVGEEGYTYKGIYQKAHPKWEGWNIILEVAKIIKDKEELSVALYANEQLDLLTEEFYREQFWDKIRGDFIDSEHTATEIFIFAVNTGVQTAIKRTQELLGVEADGIIGAKTLEAINEFNPEEFNFLFDEKEVEFYRELIEKKPSLQRFAKGWENRAVAV
jgi:lysozyme family protein